MEYKLPTFLLWDFSLFVIKEKAEIFQQLEVDMKEGKVIISKRIIFYNKYTKFKTNKKILFNVQKIKKNLDLKYIVIDIIEVKAALIFWLSIKEINKKNIIRKRMRRI